MSPQVVAGLVVLGSIAAWGLFLAYTTLGARRQKELEDAVPLPEHEEALVGARAVSGAPAYVLEIEPPPPKPRRVEDDVQGVTRRQFLNRVWALGLLIGLGQFTLAFIRFFWPSALAGGAKVVAGDEKELAARWAASRDGSQLFIAEGRFYIVPFEGDIETAKKVPAYVTSGVIDTGWTAIYRRCVHLGCAVPWCPPAKWFECPCHGSKYSVNGEYRDGPAPRSLDRFRLEIVDGKIVVDTSTVIEGPPRGTITSQPQPEGEHCVEIREG